MNAQDKKEFLIKFKKAIKNDDKATIMEMMSPLLDDLAKRIMAGTLMVNIKAHLVHGGVTGKACDMLAEMAEIRAQKFMHYKIK